MCTLHNFPYMLCQLKERKIYSKVGRADCRNDFFAHSKAYKKALLQLLCIASAGLPFLINVKPETKQTFLIDHIILEPG